MNIKDYLKNNILYLDGSMGVLLQSRGLMAGELPEKWNITHSSDIISIHRDYFNAGSNVVLTNTFGANVFKYDENELNAVICAAVNNAKCARDTSDGPDNKWIALDIGPFGKMLKPLGDLDFEDAVSAFKKTVEIGVKCGVDLIFIETMTDSYETKAALLAAKETCNLPVFVSNAYSENGKLLTGTSPRAMVALLEGMGADAIGVNCSFGPEGLKDVVNEYLTYSSLPVILKPNAGLPVIKDGKTCFDISPESFCLSVCEMIKSGVRIAGGCCGTTPEYISRLTESAGDISPMPITKKNYTVVSSYTDAVYFDKIPLLIGERINPTGKPLLKAALKSGDTDYVLKEALSEENAGVHILDVNVGLPEIDEESVLKETVSKLQTVTGLPLQIDTANPSALEGALRVYNGKPMINSVNGKMESMDTVFPLVKKYGGVVVALTLDESGIPKKAEDRVKIARNILSCAEKYGIDKKDIVFDPLALTVSSDNLAANETLKAVKLITENLSAKTSLGVSNVSFGLPCRDIINASFFTSALTVGLSAAIMNPFSDEMMKSYMAFSVLSGLDENCKNYIKFADFVNSDSADKGRENTFSCDSLNKAIVHGMCNEAVSFANDLLNQKNALAVIEDDIIPALNLVGSDYEKGTVYLPQLLMSAEAAKAAFSVLKASFKGESTAVKCDFVIATVKGDIHDIGKNIVKLMLENYGFKVHDLGKDVAPKIILDKVVELNAPLVGLSALMTTTVPAMEETVRLLKEKAPFCKTVVGGAVLNSEYAKMIGADKYAKDAMETVRYAESVFDLIKNRR